MKKGSSNKITREYLSAQHRRFIRSFNRRNESSLMMEVAIDLIGDMKKSRKEYDIHMNFLPKRYSKSYGWYEYTNDRRNVSLYYSRWIKEDWWEGRKSLKRLRQYEKREGLEAFEVIEQREKDLISYERNQELYS